MNFDYFIVLAGMRTGSNFLEANLNTLDGVTCHGEAFNPAFTGHQKAEDLLGIDRDTREADPFQLLDRIKDSDALGGFRFFHNHDQRILQHCLADTRCAKIILTRNPLESFVSLKIAQATGQWKLTNATHAKSMQITFEPDAFAAHLEATDAFQAEIRRALQTGGQTAFHVDYEDLRDVDVVNGIAAFLGTPARLSNINKKLKKQNPEPLETKVQNFAQMQKALGEIDHFNLGHRPAFEPARGPAIPTYYAAPTSGLLYMPLRSGPDEAVCTWLAAVDQAERRDVLSKFTQRSLRDWQASHLPHRSFAVLRHPVVRAHVAFCDRILAKDGRGLPEIRANLRRVHKLPIPEDGTDFSGEDGYDEATHQTAFLAFLNFLKNNLSGQTSIRVDPSWASQQVLLQGMAQFALPDAILREHDLDRDLPLLAGQVGVKDSPAFKAEPHVRDGLLAKIHDGRIAAAARDAYARDYLVFGFVDWA
ncbi:MAG: nodulation protein NodH [Yoonia sp.]|uniref:nodulation protein NodH n=1 Tax=Yoonia sp. TaxID=2212373 RepID=UPI003EF30B32